MAYTCIHLYLCERLVWRDSSEQVLQACNTPLTLFTAVRHTRGSPLLTLSAPLSSEKRNANVSSVSWLDLPNRLYVNGILNLPQHHGNTQEGAAGQRGALFRRPPPQRLILLPGQIFVKQALKKPNKRADNYPASLSSFDLGCFGATAVV